MKSRQDTQYMGGTGKLTYSWDALDGNLPDSFLKTGKPRIHLPDLHLFPLHQLLDDLRGGERAGLKDPERTESSVQKEQRRTGSCSTSFCFLMMTENSV